MTAYPKNPRAENKRLLALARGMPCLLQIPGVCNGDSDTVVAAHSNQAKHGKGKARKAHDHFTVWSCSACHTWLDTGPATRTEKERAFAEAHRRQVNAWTGIAADPRENEADRKASMWALEMLNT